MKVKTIIEFLKSHLLLLVILASLIFTILQNYKLQTDVNNLNSYLSGTGRKVRLVSRGGIMGELNDIKGALDDVNLKLDEIEYSINY